MAQNTPRLSREELVEEAQKETLAIQRLMVWQRLGYSAVAIGFLLGWWGFYGDAPTWVGVLGVIALVLGIVVSLILHTGISNARKNVHALMAAAGVDLDAPAGEQKA